MRAPPVTSARRAMSTPQRQHQIVESAAMLFDAQGYGNTSMEDVALSVSIAKPTLYGSISREPSSAGTRLYRAG